jgi:serine/threonine protein kinase
MALTIGTQLGSHEITALLGKGGMGEVYRARDLKLKREVAIKILPDEFSADADRLARFQREAQVLASLNHPNIAHIYGLEESNQTSCIVMELVEGDTLEGRLQHGPIPLSEALSLAMQIAAALEAAHERGIVHRDLKPANIKFKPDGKVKVLDFGLAKAFQPEAQTPLSNSPTVVGASMPGVILGTAAYMSPEQAKGKETDRASDVWAFGCVLYEMLTGRQAFEGDTVGEILGGIFRADPDWQRLPAGTPEGIRRLLRRCLEKERSERLKSADDARIEIKEALNAPDSNVTPAAPPKSRLAWMVAALMTLAVGVIEFVQFRAKPADVSEMRLDITTPSTPAPLEFALSPDGKYVVFVASAGGPQRIWRRALDNTDAQPIEGTEGGDFPFWSPDSRSIGFVASGKLKRLDFMGGSPQTLTNVALTLPGSWNSDGTIVVNAQASGSLSRVSAGEVIQ